MTRTARPSSREAGPPRHLAAEHCRPRFFLTMAVAHARRASSRDKASIMSGPSTSAGISRQAPCMRDRCVDGRIRVVFPRLALAWCSIRETVLLPACSRPESRQVPSMRRGLRQRRPNRLSCRAPEQPLHNGRTGSPKQLRQPNGDWRPACRRGCVPRRDRWSSVGSPCWTVEAWRADRDEHRSLPGIGAREAMAMARVLDNKTGTCTLHPEYSPPAEADRDRFPWDGHHLPPATKLEGPP